MLNVNMVSVVMLNVVAPLQARKKLHYLLWSYGGEWSVPVGIDAVETNTDPKLKNIKFVDILLKEY